MKHIKIGRNYIPVRIDPLIPPDQIRVEDVEGNELGRVVNIKYDTPSISIRDPLPPLTPRDEAIMRLATETMLRVMNASAFGAPITREKAREEAMAAMSEADRILLAKEAEPVERPLLPPEKM